MTTSNSGNTQPPVQMVLHPMDEETENICLAMTLERMVAYANFKRKWLFETFSHLAHLKPQDRLAYYQATEPVFDPSIPPPILEAFLDAGVYEPLVEVYDTEGLIKPPVEVVPAQIDPASGVAMAPALTSPALLGYAPAILGPYWQRLWAVDREAALHDLRDYRDVQRRNGGPG